MTRVKLIYAYADAGDSAFFALAVDNKCVALSTMYNRGTDLVDLINAMLQKYPTVTHLDVSKSGRMAVELYWKRQRDPYRCLIYPGDHIPAYIAEWEKLFPDFYDGYMKLVGLAKIELLMMGGEE